MPGSARMQVSACFLYLDKSIELILDPCPTSPRTLYPLRRSAGSNYASRAPADNRRAPLRHKTTGVVAEVTNACSRR